MKTEKETENIFIDETTDKLYVLQWELDVDREVEVGKLGTFLFSKGIYVYIGSAKKNMEARVNRHLKVNKKKKWHMDYLRPYVTLITAITVPLHEGECHLKQFIEEEYYGH